VNNILIPASYILAPVHYILLPVNNILVPASYILAPVNNIFAPACNIRAPVNYILASVNYIAESQTLQRSNLLIETPSYPAAQSLLTLSKTHFPAHTRKNQNISNNQTEPFSTKKSPEKSGDLI